MRIEKVRSYGALAAIGCALALAACSSGNGDGTPPPAPPGASVADAIATAARNPANDSAINPSSAFTVLQSAGVAAVVVASPPKINFTVFSDGAVKQGLTTSNARFAIAKLVPGTDSNPDRWVSYVYRTESTANAPNNVGSGPGGAPVLASAQQATTDPATPAQLVYNPDGYYTYTFSTDITDPAKTNGVLFEPNRTHRIAIQLSYTNAAGQTVRVNPYFDFTLDVNGRSVPVTDPAQTRRMTDVSSCNQCHDRLALHGGGRVDTQFCVMCHNPGTTDANSGHVLTLATMVHKIHAGRLLKAKLDAGQGGEQYVIWGFGASKHDYSEVGFPQDLRNCTKCHSAANPNTPQGDNWKTRPSKEACLTCHANNAGSSWDASHTIFAQDPLFVGPGATAKDLTNKMCADCHRVGSNIAPERVHWNQNEEHAAKYRMNIESVTFNDTPDKKGRTVTVRYFLSDPTNNDAAYDLVTPDCTNIGTPQVSCSSNTKFGNLRLYVAYQNLLGQSTAITEFSAFNNGGSAANVFAYKGTNDGNNHYTIDIPLPDDTATAVAAGTARVVSIGQIKEPKLQVKWATDPRPEAVPPELVNVVVQHAFKEFALGGPLNPRRQIVATEKCNACHGALGTTSGSNTLANAFHGGARNIVEACVVCHDANRFSNSSLMTNGLTFSESYQFKRMIHGIHGNSKRTYPFTHGNNVIGAFSKAGILTVDGLIGSAAVPPPAGTLFLPYATATTVPAGTPFGSGVENYAAEVAWPGVGINCNACHVNNSYKVDRGPLGAVISKPVVGAAADPDPRNWLVISPMAAICTACHDSAR
ncbi:MAG TPA: OmcA/MtrC family decaheme c-type cytochrome, partial [Burkholderiaceae bacterium]|nr:OmcA/MtrC family decaheme c-type cytochrome [Burkholderiaceae bacterium]